MGTVIRGGRVVTGGGTVATDVRVESGQIVSLGEGLLQPGDAVLDASGCYVMPGGIDSHTHIEMPAGDLGWNADDWYSGTAAAVAGGTTCVIDMITQDPGGSLGAALADWQVRAAPRAVADYSFHMGVIDPRPAVLAEMAAVVAAGVPSFKIYLAYKGRLMVDDGQAFQIMREAGRLGAWTLVHCENGDLIDVLIAEARAAGRLEAGVHGSTRPPVGEGEATNRAIQLARLAGAPVHIVHVSCRESLEAVLRARLAGHRVRAEACLPHLVLTEAAYERPGFAAAPFVLSPPLRSEADREALWTGLTTGALDFVATDHCPWHLKGQKDRGVDDFSRIPNGVGSIEERMALLWTLGVKSGRWSPAEFVAATSGRAARIFGLRTKGAIQVGYDADILVWDPGVGRTLSVQTQHSHVDHSAFEGMAVTGQARFVLVGGRMAARDGEPVPEAGSGRFVRRVPVDPPL